MKSVESERIESEDKKLGAFLMDTLSPLIFLLSYMKGRGYLTDGGRLLYEYHRLRLERLYSMNLEDFESFRVAFFSIASLIADIWKLIAEVEDEHLSSMAYKYERKLLEALFRKLQIRQRKKPGRKRKRGLRRRILPGR